MGFLEWSPTLVIPTPLRSADRTTSPVVFSIIAKKMIIIIKYRPRCFHIIAKLFRDQSAKNVLNQKLFLNGSLQNQLRTVNSALKNLVINPLKDSLLFPDKK